MLHPSLFLCRLTDKFFTKCRREIQVVRQNVEGGLFQVCRTNSIVKTKTSKKYPHQLLMFLTTFRCTCSKSRTTKEDTSMSSHNSLLSIFISSAPENESFIFYLVETICNPSQPLDSLTKSIYNFEQCNSIVKDTIKYS
jgi:hypothetical protein